MRRWIGLLLPVLLLACAESGGLDASGRGAPAPLLYAPERTGVVLSNTVNDKVSESRITVGRATGPRGVFIRSDGTQGSFYPGCWNCGGAMQIEEAQYAALWPLETGKTVSFLRTAPDGAKARVVIRVAGRERVETKAGSFETFRLDGRLTSLTGPEFTAQVRAWWAPKPGWVVKAEGSDSQGARLASEVAAFSNP